MRELDERAFGPSVPKPPTLTLRRWPLFAYPDPWWAVPVWLLGVAVSLLVARYSEIGGAVAILGLMVLGVVSSSRATRQMRKAWTEEWQRLGQTPEGPTVLIPTERPSARGVLLFFVALLLAAILLAFLG